MNDKTTTTRRSAKLSTPTSLGEDASRDISGALNALLALASAGSAWVMIGGHNVTRARNPQRGP